MQDPKIEALKNYEHILRNAEEHIFSPLETLFNKDTLNFCAQKLQEQKALCYPNDVAQFSEREANFIAALQTLNGAPLLQAGNNNQANPAATYLNYHQENNEIELPSYSKTPPLTGIFDIGHGYVLNADKTLQQKIPLYKTHVLIAVNHESSLHWPHHVAPHGPIDSRSPEQRQKDFGYGLRKKLELPVTQQTNEASCTIL